MVLPTSPGKVFQGILGRLQFGVELDTEDSLFFRFIVRNVDDPCSIKYFGMSDGELVWRNRGGRYGVGGGNWVGVRTVNKRQLLIKTYATLAKYILLSNVICSQYIHSSTRNQIPSVVMIRSPPASDFSRANTCPSAVSRTSTQELESESASLVLGVPATTWLYQICREVLSVDTDFTLWIGGYNSEY